MLSYVQLLATPWTISNHFPLSMEFFRQEYWSGLSFPLSGALTDPGIKPASLVSPALMQIFTTTPPGKPHHMIVLLCNSVIVCFTDSSDGKQSACNAGDPRSISGLGRSTEEGKGYPLQLFRPGEFHRLYSPPGHKESNTTE